MTWTKLPPVPPDKIHRGCLTCSESHVIAPMDLYIGVGFGSAQVTKDDQGMFDEQEESWREEKTGEESERWELGYWESQAELDPDHDWRVHLHGPLRGRVYQRQGKEHWVLVESNEGFA